MRYLKTSEAATLLNVSPNTLRAWERRFDFPKPQRSQGKHRLFTHGEIAALRDALQEGLSISSAVSRAREGLSTDTNSLVGALLSYDRERADRAIEAALALRSVERSVDEVLLPSLDEICRRRGSDSAAWAFASNWGGDWLRRAQRLTPSPHRGSAILIGDASRDELDTDALHIRAFELFCVRAGVRVLTLSARGVTGIGEVLAVHRPDVVVLAGRHLDDDTMARWAYQVRSATGALPAVLYRRGEQRVRVRNAGTSILPDGAGDAHRQLLDVLERGTIDSATTTERKRRRVEPVAPEQEPARHAASAG